MTHTATEGTATDQAREKAQDVGTQAKDKAQEAGAQARSRVRDEVDRRSTEAGDQAVSTAQALRETSGRLREQGSEPVARGIERVADGVERAGGWLRESDGDSILRDVEDFGRRNSLVVVASGAAVGFLASRLLKASSRRRYESLPEQRDGSSNGSPVGGPDPGVAPSAPFPPREGATESGLTGGTPATSPPSWQGGLGGEGEGSRRP